MQDTPVRTVFDVLTDFLASEPTSQEIMAYYLPEDLQARADYLLERNGEGELTPDEEDEMHNFMRADEMMALLKAKLKLKQKQQSE